MKPTAVIFDYGAVLSTHPALEEFEPLAAIAKMEVNAFDKLYWSNRADYDRQALSAGDYWSGFGKEAGVPISTEQIDRLIEADIALWVTLQSPMIEYVKLLRKHGFRLGLLSNMPYELGDYLRSHTKVFSLFDHITLSCDARAVKPDESIYRHCIEGLGVEPANALFVDDRIPNIEASIRYGIPAYHFISAVRFAEDGTEPHGLPPLDLSVKPALVLARDVQVGETVI